MRRGRCSFAPVAPLIAAAMLGGCAGPAIAPQPLSAEAHAGAFDARSLSDPSLREYLRRNLGREPAPAAWDFETLCWVALYYHPSLALARAQTATALAAERTAAQRPNPSLALTPGYDFTRQPGVSPWMPTISLDWLVQTGGKRQHQIDAARADAEAVRLAGVTAAWQVRNDLRRALIDAWTAQRRAAAQQTQVEAQRRLVALLRQRFEAGAIASPDVAAAQTTLLRTEAAAADAATQAALARSRVAAALGMPQRALEGVTLPEPAAPAAPDEAQFKARRSEALRSRADVLGALAKYASAEAALEVEVAKRIPDVHFGPAYQYDQGLSKWSLGVTFELPIFNHNEGPIAEALARRTETAAQLDVVQAQAAAAIDGAHAALVAAEAQERRAAALQEEVRRQAALAEQRERAGAADAVEVEGAEIDTATAAAAVEEAHLAVVAAAGDLESALQQPR